MISQNGGEEPIIQLPRRSAGRIDGTAGAAGLNQLTAESSIRPYSPVQTLRPPARGGLDAARGPDAGHKRGDGDR